VQLTSKGRYGLRAILDLAVHYHLGPIPAKAISQREDISILYLERILGRLRKFGLVDAIRGPGGGYILSKKPGEIRVIDILKAVGEPISPICYLDDQKKEGCPRSGVCSARLLWEGLGEKIRQFLEETTLEDIQKGTRGLKPIVRQEDEL